LLVEGRDSIDGGADLRIADAVEQPRRAR
jgi:hypothetical protein